VAVVVDAAGNLLITDLGFITDLGNQRIRKIHRGVITTVAGSGAIGFCGDGGQATSACLSSPVGIAVDTGGNLFIADAGNQRIRQVDPRGTINTVAGNGTTGFCPALPWNPLVPAQHSVTAALRIVAEEVNSSS
jgi:hypothetical protein